MKSDTINVHIFFRKPRKFENHSIEKLFRTIIKKKDKNLNFKIRVLPFYSTGFFKRFFNCIWAFFNQGDINHISGDVNFISLFLNKNKTINSFMDCYNLRQYHGIKKKLFKFFWFYIPIQKSKYITTISEFSRNELKKFNKIQKKIHVIPAFLPDLEYKFKRIRKTKILVIGTTKNKNLDRILEVVKTLNFEIIILGKINIKQQKFLKKNKIKFKNFIDISEKKLIDIYNHSILLLFPSLYEGFGLPIIEAQRMRVPVITSNISPMKEIVKKSGILVNPKNIDEIKYSLKKLIYNKNFRMKLIKKGYKNSFRFKSCQASQKYFQLYKKLHIENSLDN